MNILVLIKKLDETPLEREVRNGDAYGDILTFYNETDFEINKKRHELNLPDKHEMQYKRFVQ